MNDKILDMLSIFDHCKEDYVKNKIKKKNMCKLIVNTLFILHVLHLLL